MSDEEEQKVTTEVVQEPVKAGEVDLEDASNMDEQVYNQRNDLIDDSVE